MRIGAVNYLNSKPLIDGLQRLAPEIELSCDLPSRLADSLAAGRLDVALIPSIEYFHRQNYQIVSDACVACRGPVLSVKLHFRVPPAQVRRLALDEGSRTSAVLAQILFREQLGVSPNCESLPIGCGTDDTDADAVLLIGDRAMASRERRVGSNETSGSSLPAPCSFLETWDLGDRWCRWTGLPFVFAMWVARPGVDISAVETVLAETRDRGVTHLDEIAAAEAPLLGIDAECARNYLRDNLHFVLTESEIRGLQRFGQLCQKHGFVSESSQRALEQLDHHDCITR
jgi:chorismate dehydratase